MKIKIHKKFKINQKGGNYMEDSVELMKQIEVFEKKAMRLLHKKTEVIELEESLMDVVAAAERNGIKKGVLIMSAIM